MPRRRLAPLVLSLSLLAFGETRALAGLDCAEAVAEKGEVRSGVPLSHRFTFVNRGPEAVEITEVRPSCGCLAPKVDRKHLAAGEAGTLLLEVNTLTQPAGANTWRVTIRYRTGALESELPLYVSARVVTEISVEPPSLAIYTDTSISHQITVIDRRTEPLIVRAVPTSSPYVRTRLGELRRDGQGRWVRTIDVDVTADCPAGTHQETLRICTSDPTYPELKVPFTIVKRARQEVSATPSSVVLSAPAGEPLPSRVVLLGTADDRPVRVERVEADHAAVDCHWAPGPGNRATLKIRVDRSRLSGDRLRAAVRVRLSAPAQETLTIPVSCLLR